MHFELYKDKQGQWRWRLVARNGKYIANSGEGYYNKQDCLHAIMLVKSSSEASITELQSG